MRKIIFILLAFCLIACSSKSGFKYSQDIVAKERSLTPFVNSTEASMGQYLPASQYDSISIIGESMEKRVQEKIDEIEKTPAPDAKGGAEFKAASLKYFRYIKSLYSGYKKLGAAPTDDERQQALNELRDIVNRKTEVLQEMQNAQEKFATENKFKVGD